MKKPQKILGKHRCFQVSMKTLELTFVGRVEATGDA